MALKFEIIIDRLRIAPIYKQQDVITHVEFTYRGELNGVYFKESGVIKIPIPRDDREYTKLAEITEAQVQGWIKELHGEAYFQRLLERKVERKEKKAVTSYLRPDRFPWAKR